MSSRELLPSSHRSSFLASHEHAAGNPLLTSRYRSIALTSIVAVLIVALGVKHASAGPLEDFARDYANGTAFADEPDYVDLYARSANRSITFENVAERGEIITAYYSTTMLYDGRPLAERGVVMYWVTNDKVTGMQYATIDPAVVDLGLAGQVADIGTTALALSSGFVEANPVMAGAFGHPAGVAAVIALKLGAGFGANGLNLSDCIGVRTMTGSLGWGAAAWNIGMVAGGPVAAVVLGIGTGIGMWDKVKRDAPARCIARKAA